MQRHWDDSASVTCGDALHLQLSFLVVLSWRLAAGSSRLSSRNLGCESQKRDLSSARSPDAHMYWRASHRVTAAATEHLGHLIATKPRYSHPLFCVPNIVIHSPRNLHVAHATVSVLSSSGLGKSPSSKITRIMRLQLGHTAISSPSRKSSMVIWKRSPQGQGYVYVCRSAS